MSYSAARSNASASQSRALVAQGEPEYSEEDREYIKRAEENEETIRRLQLQLGRIEEMRRAAVKETNLVREIKTINALTQRKVEVATGGNGDEEGNAVARTSATTTPSAKLPPK